MRKQKLLVIGSSNIDHIIRLEAFPQPGETLSGREYHIAFGGKGANQAVAASRLGGDVEFISCVGDDSSGTSLVQQLDRDGVDISNVQEVSGATTGIAMIWLADSGENSIVIDEGANAYVTAQYLDNYASHIASADALLIQLETPPEGVEYALEQARESDTFVVVNPAPARELSDAMLSCIDMITPNETEAYALTGVEVCDDVSAQHAADILHDKGIAHVCITRGKHGVYHSHNKVGQNHSGFTVNAVDTTAAGDTFNGALITALLDGQDITRAIQFGQAASALSVQRLGAQPSIPSRQEVLSFMQECSQ